MKLLSPWLCSAAIAIIALRSSRIASPEDLKNAKKYLAEGRISLATNGQGGVFVKVDAFLGEHSGTAVIEQSHGNITLVMKDKEVVYRADPHCDGYVSTSKGGAIPDQVKNMNFPELVWLANDLNDDNIDYTWRGIDMNLKMAEYGFTHKVGLGLGLAVRAVSGKIFADDLAAQVKAVAAAVSDARMAWVSLPVMSRAGSGNHGIVAILPVYVVDKSLNKSHEEIARAFAYSHLPTSFVKSRMGRLCPVCSCAVAAGAGTAAGIVNVCCGSDVQAEKAMELVLGNITGMLCDSAKESCELKVGTGATEAFYASQLALHGGSVPYHRVWWTSTTIPVLQITQHASTLRA